MYYGLYNPNNSLKSINNTNIRAAINQTNENDDIFIPIELKNHLQKRGEFN